MTTQVRGLRAYCGPGEPDYRRHSAMAVIPQRRGDWYCRAITCHDPCHPGEFLALADSYQIKMHVRARHQGSTASIVYDCEEHGLETP